MPPVKKSTTKSTAARKEVADDGPRIAKFRGMELELTGKEPPGSMAFDLYGLGESSQDEGRLRFLNTVLGIEQLEQIRAKMDEEGVTLSQAEEWITELLESVLGAYGVTPGEAPASAKSSSSAGTSSRPTSNGSTDST